MSAYDAGLDILGAVGIARTELGLVTDLMKAGSKPGSSKPGSTNPKSGAKHAEASQKVINAGQRMGNKKLGAKFVRVGQAHLKWANRSTKATLSKAARALASAKLRDAAKQRVVTKAPSPAAAAARSTLAPSAVASRVAPSSLSAAARSMVTSKLRQSVMGAPLNVTPSFSATMGPMTVTPTGEEPPATDSYTPGMYIIANVATIFNTMGALLEKLQPGSTEQSLAAWQALQTTEQGATGLQARGISPAFIPLITTMVGLFEELIGDDAASLVAEATSFMNTVSAALDADFAAVEAGNTPPSTDWQGMYERALNWVQRAQAALGATPGQLPSAGGASGTSPAPPNVGLPTPWTPNTPYAVGSQVTSTGNLYMADVAGTSGTTAPSAPFGKITDGTVTWYYAGPDPAFAAQQGADTGGWGGGGGGGGGDEGGGGGGGGEDPFADEMEEEAPRAEDPFADEEGGGSPIDEDLAPSFEEEGDPFAEGGAFADENTDEMLGLDFKWQYIFAPWEAGQDWKAEKDAQTHDTGPGMSAPMKTAETAVKVSTARQRRLDAAQKRMAALQAQQIASGTYAPQQSSTFAERLSATRAFLGTPGSPAPITEGETVSGENNDLTDYLADSWSEDITDEPADPFRRTASLHNGAAYLQERSYPRHGASAGQEGGIMFPRETVHVFGHQEGGDAYDCGCDVLGAGPPKPKPSTVNQFRLKTTPAGNKHVSLVPGKPRGGDHKRSVANAQAVAKRAISVGTKLANVASKARPTLTKTTTVHGAPLPRGKVTPRRKGPKLSPTQLKALATKVVKAGKSLGTQAGKHSSQFSASVNREKSGAAAVRNTPAGLSSVPTKIKGDSDDAHALMYGAVEELLGEEVMNEALADDLIDVVTGEDEALPPVSDTSASMVLSETEGDFGCGPMPTLADAQTALASEATVGPDAKTDQTSYNSKTMGGLPSGAIVFDNSRALENNAFGSFNLLMKGPVGNAEGFVYQGDSGKGHWNGRWGSWYGVISDWGYDAGRREETPGSIAALSFVQDPASRATYPSSAFGQLHGASLKAGWGPLVGNPESPTFKNLRYDAGGDQWFWFYGQAPDWAKSPSENLRLTQLITDRNACITAAKTDAATTAIQDQLDADTAKEEAKRIASEDLATNRAAELQAKADEAAARQQQIADESVARQQSAQMDIDVKAQQAQAEIERAQQQQEFEQGERAFTAAQTATAPPRETGETGEEAAVEAEMAAEDTLMDEEANFGPFDTGEFNLEASLDEEPTELSGTARMKSHITY